MISACCQWSGLPCSLEVTPAGAAPQSLGEAVTEELQAASLLQQGSGLPRAGNSPVTSSFPFWQHQHCCFISWINETEGNQNVGVWSEVSSSVWVLAVWSSESCVPRELGPALPSALCPSLPYGEIRNPNFLPSLCSWLEMWVHGSRVHPCTWLIGAAAAPRQMQDLLSHACRNGIILGREEEGCWGCCLL